MTSVAKTIAVPPHAGMTDAPTALIAATIAREKTALIAVTTEAVTGDAPTDAPTDALTDAVTMDAPTDAPTDAVPRSLIRSKVMLLSPNELFVTDQKSP